MAIFRTTAAIAIVLAALSIGIYWFISRPTPEEKIVKDFFSEFKRSDYTGAQEYTLDDDFYEMAASTSVVDTDGAEYLIRDQFPPGRAFLLQAAVETYVRQHIAKWKYLGMDTQRLDENNSVVTFRLEIGVRDFTDGDIMGSVHDGRVEGRAYMVKNSDDWAIEKFDLNIFSDDGFSLHPYLSQVH